MLPEIVTTALTHARLPIPELDRVDREGYSTREVKAIVAEQVRRGKAEEDA